MRGFLRVRAFFAAMLLLSTPVLAQSDIPPSPIAQAELAIVEHSARVTFTLPPGWHIYGDKLGDTGLPTRFAWTLPEGITAQPTEWPDPERITMEGFVDLGYHNHVTATTPLVAAREGISGTVRVKADWLVCKDSCIPESATLSASLSGVDSNSKLATPTPTTDDSPLTTALLLAFLGGIILNIMPCVLPILALKALALSKKASVSRAAAARQGVSYTAGVVVSFIVIAGVMLALKASGNAVGWGFQLQNPAFVGFLIFVMLAVAANLLGMFELPVLFGAHATKADEDKLSGSFMTGTLAVLVATPCTAPFMATAIGATLAMHAASALAVFASLGFGMASPFLIISLWPAARRLIPKPGAWMHRFRQFLAIPMLATAIWLGSVLMHQLTPNTIETTGGREPYSAARLIELREAGKPVLVDATAAWCITCKINERVALNPDDMQQFFREHNVTLMIADWTNSDPEITEYLAGFGRNGVPLVVYYPPHEKPVVLPQVLTKEAVRGVINAPAKHPAP